MDISGAVDHRSYCVKVDSSTSCNLLSSRLSIKQLDDRSSVLLSFRIVRPYPCQ
ncbi:hypothetical protein DPMN_165937 [Dreissena polymorpha]|uniref:Uncharacterized protein n=1 Tax=Dreissena polymorpha TaxID=45954 RepID=A0A9D4EXT6_DREPO|nr:hypothetical protein DPMN_165937 [Dreissena polymorpha]